MRKQTRTGWKGFLTGTSGENQKAAGREKQAVPDKLLTYKSTIPAAKRSPSMPPDWILKLLEDHKVNPDWITSGTEPMLLPEDKELPLVPGKQHNIVIIRNSK